MAEQRKYLLITLSLALCLRLLFIAATLTFPVNSEYHANDSRGYLILAQELLAHGNFSRTGALFDGNLRPYSPEIVRVPGYPLFLIPGVFLGKEKIITVGLQTILSLLTVYLIFQIAIILFNNLKVAFVAASIFALDPMSIFFNVFILSEILFTFSITAFVWFFLNYLINKNTKLLIISAMLLTASTFVRPITYYLPLCILLSMLLWFTYNKVKMRSIFIHSLVFLLFSMGPLLLWQLRNYAIAGYSGFSAISEINLYFYNSAAVTAINEGRSYIDQQIKLGIWDLDQYFANHPEQQEWSDAQRFDYMRESALKIIKSDPLLYFNIHMKGILRVLFDPGMVKYFKMFKYQSDDVQFLGDFVDYGLLKTIVYLYKVKPLMFWANIFFGIILFLCILFSAIAIFFGKIDYSYQHIVLFIIIIYFLILSGGPGDSPRFRLPIMPLISVFAGYGVLISLEGCRYLLGLSKKKLFSGRPGV